MEGLSLKALTKITNDMRRLLQCKGVTLEAVFVEAEAPRVTVLVFHVDPARSLVKTGSEVVKFSQRRFAIPNAECLKLATPQCYRKYEGSAGGIRDEMEARYREDIRSFLTKYGDSTSFWLRIFPIITYTAPLWSVLSAKDQPRRLCPRSRRGWTRNCPQSPSLLCLGTRQRRLRIHRPNCR